MLLIICVGVCALVRACVLGGGRISHSSTQTQSNTFCCTQSEIIYSNTIIIKVKAIIVNVYEYFISIIILVHSRIRFFYRG